jgi:hypothetical protein
MHLTSVLDISLPGVRENDQLCLLPGQPAMIVSDNVLCQEEAGGFGQQVSALTVKGVARR